MAELMDVVEVYASICGPGRRENSDGSTWLFTCPKCGKKDKLRVHTRKRGNKGDLGAFYCYTCDYKGWTPQFVAKYGTQLPDMTLLAPSNVQKVINWELVQIIYTYAAEIGSLTTAHRTWLTGRGIDPNAGFFSSSTVSRQLMNQFNPEDLEHVGLYYQDRKWNETVPYAVLRPNRIVIPYKNPDNPAWVCYLRSRNMDSDGGEDRYRAPKGVPQNMMLYGAQHLPARASYCILTEGEFKAQAALQLGLHAMATPGMGSSHRAAAMYLQNMCVKRAYVIYDSETGVDSRGEPKQEQVDRMAARLIGYCSEYRVMAHAIHLPLLGEPKMDLDRFILLHGETARDVLGQVISAQIPLVGTKKARPRQK